jgi:glyceraldehyde 3-phosphate dehydrogenase
MKKKIAINGFGRIGRLVMRHLLETGNAEIVGINDLTDNETLAHLFKYDTAHGTFPGEVSYSKDSIIIDGKPIHATAIKNPAELPWKELDVDIVLECTGIFLSRDTAQLHLDAGAKKVILSAPAKDNSIKTIVLGVNDHEIDADTQIYSNASCTTNCLAPIAKVIVDHWGVQKGSLSTVHAYTGDQNLQDSPHRDLRRARAAAQNIIPTSTGATKAASLVVPQLKGKISAIAIRVPVITGSLIDLSILTEKSPVSVEEINNTFSEAAENKYAGYIQYSEEHLVSTDIVGNKHSAIFDAQLTTLHEGMMRVFAWYDNESGYAARLGDLALRV